MLELPPENQHFPVRVRLKSQSIDNEIPDSILIAQFATYGQQNAPSAPKGTYKFEVNSKLVVVNVSARDRNGAALDGLSSSDFTVTEDGKAQ